MAQDSTNKLPTILLVVTIIIFVLFLVRIGYIIVSEAENNKTYNDPNIANVVVRGDILDRNGNVLASQTSQWSLYFRLSAINDLNYAAMTVSPYIGMSIDEILAQASRYNTYALIKNRIDMSTAARLQEAINEAGLANQLVVQQSSLRSYATLFHACQLVGFVNAEGVGSEGIEYSYDDLLGPYPGLNESTTYGANVSLTIDLDIQYLLDVQVQNIVQENHPDYVMGLVADAKSGEILAMSSYPWYDLNYYNLSSADERLNRTVAYNYEPGSVFKVFTLAKCLEAGIDTTTPFYCDGSEDFTVDGSTFTINCHGSHGQVDGRQMISKSCNGAIASWCLQLSDEDFYDFLRLLGFGSRPSVKLGGTTSGFIAPLSTWSNRSKATMAFGQEISVNALQIVRAATAVANGGLMSEPSVVKEIREHSGNLVWANEPVQTRVFSEETASALVDYMETAVEEGTARKAALSNVRIAAKTGTAEIINPETGSYADGTNLASTLALAPAEDPSYIIYIAIAAPKGNSVWGADIAAPACGNVVRGLASQGKIRASDQNIIQLN